MYQLSHAEEKMVDDVLLRMERKESEEKEEKWAVFRHPLYDNMVEGSSFGRLRKFETKEIMIPTPDWKETGKLHRTEVHLCKNGNDKVFGVHQIILPCFVTNIDGKPTIDHKDRDPSNNRLSNLRYATRTEQQHNRGKQDDTSSSYIGVSFDKKHRKWESYITLKNGQLKHLGFFDNELDAVFTRDLNEVSEWGEFANTNVL